MLLPFFQPPGTPSPIQNKIRTPYYGWQGLRYSGPAQGSNSLQSLTPVAKAFSVPQASPPLSCWWPLQWLVPGPGMLFLGGVRADSLLFPSIKFSFLGLNSTSPIIPPLPPNDPFPFSVIWVPSDAFLLLIVLFFYYCTSSWNRSSLRTSSVSVWLIAEKMGPDLGPTLNTSCMSGWINQSIGKGFCFCYNKSCFQKKFQTYRKIAIVHGTPINHLPKFTYYQYSAPFALSFYLSI